MVFLSVFSSLDQWLTTTLDSFGLSPEAVYYSKAVISILFLAVLAFLLNWIAKNVILALIWKFAAKSKSQWIKFMVKNKVFRRLSHLVPIIIIYALGPLILGEYPRLADLTYLITNVYIIIVVWIVLYAFLNAAADIYDTFDIARARPIKGYVQILKIIIGIVAAILILSVLLDRSPVVFLTGLGAMTAILILVFRDTILGFVGGVQVTANDLVQIGDWIEMPKYGADGDVTDITLHTVLVQNWDRTISVIPTYALISEGFKNWRGMVECGGRRIMRHIYIDMRTIRFCDEEMLARFEKIHYLKDYIKTRKKEIDEYNKKHNFDPSSPVNGRRMTNLGTFRRYITNYLANHPLVIQDQIYMVRQLQPNEKGLPLEVYCFAKTVEWVNYENIQADIFDHILSVISFFDLKIYQYPTSEMSVTLTEQSPVVDFDSRNITGRKET